MSTQPQTLDRTLLRAAVEAAIRAPSLHNSQPWRFRLREGALEVFGRPDPAAADRRSARLGPTSGLRGGHLQRPAGLRDGRQPRRVAAVPRAPAAVAAADALGYPAVLKAADPKLVHKSGIGGVTLNLPDAEAVVAVDVKLRLAPIGNEPDPTVRELREPS
jgi:hypothetical protein